MRICNSSTHRKGAKDAVKIESPLLGGDLGVGKAVIREMFTEISRPRNSPLTPPKRGIAESPPKTYLRAPHRQGGIIHATL